MPVQDSCACFLMVVIGQCMALDGSLQIWMVLAFSRRLLLVLAYSLKIWLDLCGAGWFCSVSIVFGSFRIVLAAVG